MSVQGLRTFDTYADGEAIVVDATKNIVAITGAPTAQAASAIHGARGAKFHAVTPAEAVVYGANAADTRSYYGIIDTAGAGTASIGAIKNGATFLARIRANPTGTHWEIADQTATAAWTSTSVYTVGQPFRHDVQWSYSAGNITVWLRIFLGANVEGFIPDESSGPITFASASTPNRFSVGSVSSTWAVSIDTVREYGDVSAWPVPFLASAALSQLPVYTVSNTNWTVNGASTINAALADNADTTYIQSAAAGTSTARFWLGPGITPDTDSLLIRAGLTGAASGTMTAKIYEGIAGAQRVTRTVPVTTTLTTYTLSLTAPEIASITDWSNLYGELIWVP